MKKMVLMSIITVFSLSGSFALATKVAANKATTKVSTKLNKAAQNIKLNKEAAERMTELKKSVPSASKAALKIVSEAAESNIQVREALTDIQRVDGKNPAVQSARQAMVELMARMQAEGELATANNTTMEFLTTNLVNLAKRVTSKDAKEKVSEEAVQQFAEKLMKVANDSSAKNVVEALKKEFGEDYIAKLREIIDACRA